MQASDLDIIRAVIRWTRNQLSYVGKFREKSKDARRDYARLQDNLRHLREREASLMAPPPQDVALAA